MPMEQCFPLADHKPCRILLVEDRPLQIELTRAILEDEAYQLTEAHNGLEAVEIMQTSPHHLVLMDYHMPGLNGAEATRAIRQFERTHDVHPSFIIGLTASAMPDEVADCMASGMDKVLVKPIDVSALTEVVRTSCSRARQPQ